MTLTPRLIIIIALLFVVLITTTTFIALYRQQTDSLIALAVAKFTTCGNITDELACFDKPGCKGIYGPSCPGCADSVFLQCQKITANDKALNAAKQNLCLQTSGVWQVSPRGNQCSCPAGLTFSPLTGCQQR